MHRRHAAVVAVGLLASAAGVDANPGAFTYDNAHPEIQMWSYPAGSANGAGAVRDRASTFASFSYLNGDTNEPVFYPGNGLDPSRRGSFLIVADTSESIPLGLPLDRYQIDSLRVTTTLLGNLISEAAGRVLPYDNTLDDAESLTVGQDADAGHPIEMYGLGLQGDFDAVNFDGSPTQNEFRLGSPRWRQYREGEEGYDPQLDPADQSFAPYQFFGVDTQGRDVENSVNGGYSATAPENATARFTPDPFAIGKVYDAQGGEFVPGDLLDVGDQFVFEPNLQDAGVLAYLQQSLSDGHLGFSFSSMHQPAGHTGTIAYPDFYLDDLDVGNNPDGAAPRIELSVTILDPVLAGDYDADGAVDAADYQLWRAQYGTAGPEADGNADGVVDAADYTLWRDNAATGSALAAGAVAVPEPSGAGLVALGGMAAAFCGWVEWFIRPKRPQS
ncbi:hypothetical protein KOR34_22700 [Posidoniimonas corsicana]|uniref:Dockerin domain-containing protein n=1 Tax=Posidoniimonas corsicana TaxID=1938618 RepID=A0A5C5VI16_9BACT|nr:hypothetical protein [Posidoniimonas corsicana]TWT37322.1 hypothetical protein KOR34_22700 [Posidoniimonas corsicana]